MTEKTGGKANKPEMLSIKHANICRWIVWSDVDGAIKSGSKPTTLSSRLQNGLLWQKLGVMDTTARRTQPFLNGYEYRPIYQW